MTGFLPEAAVFLCVVIVLAASYWTKTPLLSMMEWTWLTSSIAHEMMRRRCEKAGERHEIHLRELEI
ncbi:hypothetical protein E6C60_0592 [Paenibacillus algicola]|uniref:Uncharacterized protein n=1 Tax=Paenibacillus algicola TaxID=2565926 RepID=A0A4P8XG93_9BACL|nr:hypothetical protein E6C60_0592 [Paenibacillus algicola]